MLLLLRDSLWMTVGMLGQSGGGLHYTVNMLFWPHFFHYDVYFYCRCGRCAPVPAVSTVIGFGCDKGLPPVVNPAVRLVSACDP